MSWSYNFEAKNEIRDDGLPTVVVQLESLDKNNVGNEQCTEERDEQINSVVQGISTILVESGLLEHADVLSVSMSGHANKNHAYDKEWSNEFVNINVFVKKYQSE